MPDAASSFQRIPPDELAWLGTGPIPARAYHDPAYFELERQAVFLKSWIHVAHVCELPEPGCFVRRDLEFARASLLIARGRDGVLRAFHNVCTHRGTQLVEEASGRQSKFTCPYHMWTYGTDGALLSAPDFEAFHLDKPACALPQVALQECGGMLFVNFDPDAPPLRAWLGAYAERLEQMPAARATTFSQYSYEIDANWKLTYDNFQENYHLRFIHPRSGGAGIGGDNPFGYPASLGFDGPHRTQRIWSNPAPDLKPFQRAAAMRGLPAVAEQGLLDLPFGRDYLAFFPNLFVIGTPTQPFSHTVYPISAERSRGVVRLYWVGEDGNASTRFAREYALAQLRDIHCEDIAMIERGQKGLASGALDHIHFQSMEALCRHLFNEVDSRVQAHASSLGERP
ncbi:phenylpropionate dioxygenase-like ring-hydroxylating dioxygenase large terminal subunit [Novosphingobium sp. PhB55]|uniref:aromatic ring-hydroxylating oxygenase subunit alpha n=1 Tax=unclassified Novosphingobium TaxID=2644732 RepID=UPI001066AF55|nr:aromatic ring-hydroxylating dioxygenase subunit alpha [Novosphingobium sp. PhB55]TDW64305.1 phenylpropionate dioxygenase-like ring-hydroxylating dioxygenase large terminal subunit [Novosphingobium sp. PhB55]